MCSTASTAVSWTVVCSTEFTDLVHIVGYWYLAGGSHFRGSRTPLEENMIRDMTVYGSVWYCALYHSTVVKLIQYMEETNVEQCI